MSFDASLPRRTPGHERVPHAATTDAHSQECQQFLRALADGRRRAWLEEFVVHELSYSWHHYFQQATRDDVAAYILGALAWPGVIARDKEQLARAVRRWREARVGFVDALLAESATADGRAVYTKNVRDFSGMGIDVPNPLPP